jgi:hypothetical protein
MIFSMPPKKNKTSKPFNNTNPITQKTNKPSSSELNGQKINSSWNVDQKINKQSDNFSFGDVSAQTTTSNKISQETMMDKKLTSLNLTRRSIPKDGSCLFRAICSQKFGNQNFHYLRKKICFVFNQFLFSQICYFCDF